MTEFRLLGSLEALDGGRSLALGGHRQRAVLAVLLLRNGEVVSVDAIVDAVWGEQVPRTAVAYLQNCISRLRRQLGHEAIETRAPGYVLRVDPGAIDAERFSRLVGEAAGRPAPSGSRCSRTPLPCGAGRPSRTSSSRTSRSRRSGASTHCGSRRSRAGSRPSSSSGARWR